MDFNKVLKKLTEAVKTMKTDPYEYKFDGKEKWFTDHEEWLAAAEKKTYSDYIRDPKRGHIPEVVWLTDPDGEELLGLAAAWDEKNNEGFVVDKVKR